MLKGDVADPDNEDDIAARTKEDFIILGIRKVDLAYHMCDDKSGANAAIQLKKNIPPAELVPSSVGADQLEARAAVLCYGAYRETRERKYLAQAKKSHKRIEHLRNSGSPNFSDILCLIILPLASTCQRYPWPHGRGVFMTRHWPMNVWGTLCLNHRETAVRPNIVGKLLSNCTQNGVPLSKSIRCKTR